MLSPDATRLTAASRCSCVPVTGIVLTLIAAGVLLPVGACDVGMLLQMGLLALQRMMQHVMSCGVTLSLLGNVEYCMTKQSL